jgi:FixJ family two-component response regulator
MLGSGDGIAQSVPAQVRERVGIDNIKGQAATVFIVEDVPAVRMALSCLLVAAGYQVRVFDSAERFLEEQDAGAPGCLLLDVRLPGRSGLELQATLAGSPGARPIVFLTGTDDIQAGVRAMRAGAVDFLTKPVDGERLIAAVEQAIQRGAEQRQERAIHSIIQQRYQTLTRCERRVMTHIVRGLLNKQIAFEVCSSEKSVKIHRERVMAKMQASSVAELVRLGARVGVAIEPTLSSSGTALHWKQPHAQSAFEVKRACVSRPSGRITTRRTRSFHVVVQTRSGLKSASEGSLA